MKYFKVNYYKLQNLSQVNYCIIVIIIIFIFFILLLIASFTFVSNKTSFYGIYYDNILKIKINNKLSDTLKDNQYIIFNDKKTKYEILEYGAYEIINNEIYQEVSLTIEEDFINNEVGLVELYYDKKRVIKYIFELFK